ncbi:MAG: hypothetical protein HY316_05410 [Acidobacteria bacterium]|nr:hypothetical protein [Acidobacteriota bacterium]
MMQNRVKVGKKSAVRLLTGMWLATITICSLVTLELSAAALQGESPAAGPVPQVSVGRLDASPGASIMVPLYFVPDPKTPLRSLAVDIEFVSNNLKFQSSAMGFAAEQGNVDITSSVTEGKPDDKNVTRSKLHVTAAIKDPNPKEGLPDGLLAYLLFNLSLEAKPFAISLTPTIISAQDIGNPPKKVAQVATEPGAVNVLSLDAMPEMACFFFTH